MKRTSKQIIIKALSIGVVLMGFTHIAATFSPLIADKLALLPDGAQDAFLYFSLMCGALLVLGGGVTYFLSGKIAEYDFVRKPYILALSILNVDGILAVFYMPHNPFAWVIFSLTICLMLVNLTRVIGHQ